MNKKRYFYAIGFSFVMLFVFINLTNTYFKENYYDYHKVGRLDMVTTNVQNHKNYNSSSVQYKYDYISRYEGVKECNIGYKIAVNYTNGNYNYSAPSSDYLHSMRVVRAVLFYFPINSFDHFFVEFKWLYHSWIEMMKYEPDKWRTDLVLFIDDSKKSPNMAKFKELGCSFNNIRMTKADKPMCVMINYKALSDRNIDKYEFSDVKEQYSHLFGKLNVFSDDKENLKPFYAKLTDLKHYGYVDSILIAFEGYKYFNNNSYDFLLRSDIDVFLTPLFATWLPRYCNDFVVGGGGYSDNFNVKRLKRIASDLELGFASVWNLGSTWYSTPKQFRLVAYLTLISMLYVSNEEFTSVERKGGFGVLNWPEWHYGVLLLYGQNIIMNHLIATKELEIVKLENLVDCNTVQDKSVFQAIHLHVFHGDGLFSKFAFKDGRYAAMNVSNNQKFIVKYYALYNALQSSRLSLIELKSLFHNEISRKS